jgi:dolichyl-phosphate-mannose-protein mannosyltransferase
MIAARASRFRNPVFLIALAAALLAFVVQSGELGTSDTTHRLRSAHSFWTSESPVSPNEYPEFGVHGRNGSIQSWFGIGQSILMLPFDVLGTAVEKLPLFAQYADTDPSVRDIVVVYLTQILITVLTALVCFKLLREFGFSTNHSIAGVLAFLVATTHLHYTQNMQENNYICMLTLTGFAFELEWARTGNHRALLIGTGALGLNLLTRITTGMDLVAGVIFVLLVLWFHGRRGRELRDRVRTYAFTAIPTFCLFGLLDRAYQFYRFGSWTNTYAGLVARETIARDPTLPRNWPWTTPWHQGFLGPLIAPEKSIFLFDPLILLALILIIVHWLRMQPVVRAYAIACGLMLFAYLSFYARYFAWAGDFAWGDRYISTTVELVALIAIPLLLKYRREAGRLVWAAGVFLLCASILIQLVSLMFWLPLEIYQQETLGHPTWVIALRAKNILAFAFGRMEAWGLNNVPMTQDPWDFVHITCWNFLPFLLRRVGEASGWAVRLAFALWLAGLTALGATLLRIRSVASRIDDELNP